jgi:acetate kinase
VQKVQFDREHEPVAPVRILAINCGSSSLKFDLISLTNSAGAGRLVQGIVEHIGRPSAAILRVSGDDARHPVGAVPDHGSAVRKVIKWIQAGDWLEGAVPDAVGHRVVHGGPRLFEPTVIDEQVIGEIEEASEIAPLHNSSALQAIAASRELFGGAVPMVAVFDTAFHHDMPARASRYAIPPATADEHGIRRYGFHGLAHRYMAGRCAELLARPVQSLRLITLQLGGGCSAAAVRGGKSMDTSMGFTPLEGLVMGTRSGDIDPAVMRYLCDRRGTTPAEVDDWLNHRAGLLGVSGASSDVRELLALERQGNAAAALALDLFCYRLRKYVGAYMAVLGGAEAVAFGGGIGENSPDVRARACCDMDWCGLRIDDARNRSAVGCEGEIGAEGSPVRALVIPVDEELLIARDTFDCLNAR